jgi:teichuronic acid exporter
MAKSDLHGKTVKGFFWSFIENFSSQAVTFAVGIVLSRLLSPEMFGIVGMIMIFIAVSDIFVSGGFQQSLIRKQDVGPDDFSTIFYTNLCVALFFCVILRIIAPWIASFYNQPIIEDILPVFGIVVFIDSLSLVQRTEVTKRLDFKLLTKISVISNLVGGVIGIAAAYNGLGVWSLVMKSIFQKLVSTILLWLQNNWRPTFVFRLDLLKEHFSYGKSLLLSVIVDTIFANLYYLVIGKYFTSSQVGYYSRADQFQKLPSSNFSNIIARVSFPVMSSLSDNLDALRDTFTRILIGSVFVSFSMMLTLAAVSDTLILALLGREWQPSVVYLQILSVIGAFYPIHHLNLLIPQVMNRTDIYLRIEIIKKSLLVLIVIMGVYWGILWMLNATLVYNFVVFFIHARWTYKFIKLPIRAQVISLFQPIFLGLIVVFFVLMIRYFFFIQSPLLFLAVQLLSAICFFLLLMRFFFKRYLTSFLSLLKLNKR